MDALATVTRDALTAAHDALRPWVRRTPVLRLPPGALGVSCHLVLKLEFLQVGASFKARGAFLSLLRLEERDRGVVAASGGNHGVAVAEAAARLGVPASIFVPETSAPAKLERLRRSGAEVVVGGASYAEALAASQRRAVETGAAVLHAYDQVNTVLGQGTLGKELEEDAGDLDLLLVSVGGAGLIGGIAGWTRGELRLIGVETPGTAALARALEAGAPVDVEVSGLGADALGARRVGELGFALASAFVESVAMVEDDALREAQEVLWRELRVAVEPAAAAGLAALRSGAVPVREDEVVGLVLCGANVDPASLDGP